jgi:hypothetical protein
MRRHNLHYEDLTPQQRDEMMYYERCSICRRLVFEIYEFGCDLPVCQVNGVVSTAEAGRRNNEYIDPSDSI